MLLPASAKFQPCCRCVPDFPRKLALNYFYVAHASDRSRAGRNVTRKEHIEFCSLFASECGHVRALAKVVLAWHDRAVVSCCTLYDMTIIQVKRRLFSASLALCLLRSLSLAQTIGDRVDIYFGDWHGSAPHTTRGALQQWNILTRGDAMNPSQKGAVLRYINSYTYDTLARHASTDVTRLDRQQEIYLVVSGHGSAVAGGRLLPYCAISQFSCLQIWSSPSRTQATKPWRCM